MNWDTKEKGRMGTGWQLAVTNRAKIRPYAASCTPSGQRTALCTKRILLRKVICKGKRKKRGSLAGNKHRFA